LFLYGEPSPQKISTLQDYSDTTVRYSAISGIFTIGRQSLVIKEDQLNLAKTIVTAGPPLVLEDDAFLAQFYDPTLPALPTDDAKFLEHDIQQLTARLNVLSDEPGTKHEIIAAEAENILQLKKQRQGLEEQLIVLKELKFYRTQGEQGQVEDIINLFESIRAREIIGGSDYMPAWAEWGVWRVFLSINTIQNPISATRGFKINSELYPIHHAKGGAQDLLFEYENDSLIPVEITLNTGERQYAAEREPVRTHVYKLMEEYPSASVTGIFVAPSIQPRTAHDFLTAHTAGDYSARLGRALHLNIIPLTIEQLCMLLPGKKHGCSSYPELRKVLDSLIELRPAAGEGDGNDWLNNIANYFS
jgi:hypothetical protein